MLENTWITVLMITVLGMGLLFLALAFFYGLLSAMARLLQDRAEAPALPTAPDPAPDPGDAAEEEVRSRAAAVAIALARAGLPAPQARGPALPAEAAVASPWWSLHHGRRLASGTRRGRG